MDRFRPPIVALVALNFKLLDFFLTCSCKIIKCYIHLNLKRIVFKYKSAAYCYLLSRALIYHSVQVKHGVKGQCVQYG